MNVATLNLTLLNPSYADVWHGRLINSWITSGVCE